VRDSSRHEVFIVTFFILWFWASSASPAWSQSDHTARLVEEAKKEGEIVLYVGLAGEGEAVRAKLQQKYPFLNIKANHVQNRQILSKVLTEARAGKHLADVIQTLSFGMYTLRTRGVLGRYVSPETQFYPKEFKEEGYWTAMYTNPYVVAYNTKLVARDRIPKTYEDLLKPGWHGQMLMEVNKPDWFAGMLQIMGREKGLSYMRELSKQNIPVRTGHTLLAQLVAAGEAPIDINIPSHIVDNMKQTGAPIDWTAPGPVPGIMSGIGIAANPPHPSAAKLVVDYILSKEGQLMMQSWGRTVARSDLPVPPGMARRNLTVIPVKAELGENLEEYSALLREIFTN
jgi:iron(III) transport system substrate-binding protein